MHPQTQIQNSITATSVDAQHNDLDLDCEHRNNNDENIILKTHEPGDLDHGDAGDLEDDLNPVYCINNNAPESYSVCQSKVTDWLNNRSTFIERKASVKFAVSKTLDPTQTGRSSHRSISLNPRPKLSIIGFRKKPVHQTDGKSKHNDKAENIKLFRNRSEPGRDYCLLITEPVSPRVSCVGRVGSVRVPGRKAGVWRSFKAAFSNLVQTNRVTKVR